MLEVEEGGGGFQIGVGQGEPIERLFSGTRRTNESKMDVARANRFADCVH